LNPKMLSRLLGALVLAGAFPVAGQDLRGFERVLLPIFLPADTPGLNESHFTTGPSFSAFSHEPFQVFPYYASFDAEPTVGTNRAEYPFALLEGPRSAGRFVWIPRTDAHRVWFSHSIESWSTGSAPETAELPVVRESGFLDQATVLYPVPFQWRYESDDPLWRQPIPVYWRTLRVYAFGPETGASVSVILWLGNLGPGAPPLRTFELALDRRDGEDPSWPVYGTADLPDVCIPFSAHTPCLESTTIQLEILPATTGLRYWAFVTAVENTTQHVRVIVPR